MRTCSGSIRAGFAALSFVLMMLGATAAQAQVPTLTDEFLSGKWHENRACSGSADYEFSIVFRTLQIGSGDPTDYVVSGPQQISLVASGTPIGLQVVDQDTMVMSIGTSQTPIYRCPASAAAALAPAPVQAPAFSPPPAIAPAATGLGGTISVAFLDGSWKDNGLCLGPTQMQFDFASNVQFAGAPATSYAIAGNDRIAVTTPSGPLILTVRYVDPNRIFVDDGKGNSGEAWRCSPAQSGFAAPAAAPSPPAAPAPSALTPAFMFGRWTATNCAAVSTFRPDGTLLDSSGVVANWSLGAGFLTFSLPSGVSDTVTLRAVDANTVQRIDTAGNVVTWRRCP